MQKGDSELTRAEGKFDEGSASSATSHFNNAIGEYNIAVEQLSAAMLPEGNDDALKALKQGLNEARARPPGGIGKGGLQQRRGALYESPKCFCHDDEQSELSITNGFREHRADAKC